MTDDQAKATDDAGDDDDRRAFVCWPCRHGMHHLCEGVAAPSFVECACEHELHPTAADVEGEPDGGA